MSKEAINKGNRDGITAIEKAEENDMRRVVEKIEERMKYNRIN